VARAIFNGAVIAESDDIEVVEGNQYFPIESLDKSRFEDSSRTTSCPWKGVASYWNIEVDGKRADNAAWYYPSPKPGAEAVAGRVAFYGMVSIEA